jgi:predicted butyrate kinase (DUF1464 family)
MPRVIGIDPGTVSIDVCGLDNGRLFLDRSLPTASALAQPSTIIDLLDAAAPLDLVAGPSGYGLPLVAARDLTEPDLRLAYLAGEHESGGIGGLRALTRVLARSATTVVLTPGVVHLDSVPAHRKVNRIDMGTADKVCAAALAIQESAERRGCDVGEVSLILLELGGAFTGARAAGALDGEVAFLAGTVTKSLLFGGGAATVAGHPDAPVEALAAPVTDQGRIAWEAFLESAVKSVATLAVSVPGAQDVILSGRVAHLAGVHDELAARLARVMPAATVRVLNGFAKVSKEGAQGAALLADGLAGGGSTRLVETLGIREARGSVLDHLYVISPAAARSRLGIG